MGCSDMLESKTVRAHLFSLIAGVLVGIGWWLFIDGMVTGQKMNGPTTKDVAGYAWLPGVGVTIAFVMINGFDWDYMRSDANEIFSGGNVGFKARCFLFVAILLGLGCLCGSIFIMMEKYLNATPKPAEGSWPGISVFAQSCLIFFACVAPCACPPAVAAGCTLTRVGPAPAIPSSFVMRAGTMQSSNY